MAVTREGTGQTAAVDRESRVDSAHAEAIRLKLVIVLAVVSGATDAIGFLGLGGAFTSVMTGNMVLLGLGAGTGNATLAIHAGLAIAAFVVGCVIGARIAGVSRDDDPVWPAAVNRALIAELVMFAVFAVGWWALGAHPTTAAAQLPLLTVNALALGTQSSMTQRFGVSGLSTTYLTGTLTHVVIQLTSGHARHEARRGLQLLGGLVIGAILSTALARDAPYFAPLAQLLGISLVLLGGMRLRQLRNPPA